MPIAPGRIPAIPQTLYPRKATLDEAVQHSMAQLPITEDNELMAILMTYHNTLLQVVSEGAQDFGWRTNHGDKAIPNGLTTDSLVVTRMRNGNVAKTPARAGGFCWAHHTTDADIIEYRVIPKD